MGGNPLIDMLAPLSIFGVIFYIAIAVKTGYPGKADVTAKRNAKFYHIAEDCYLRGEISFEMLQQIRRNLKQL